MKDTRSAGEVEPRVLRPLEVGQPPFAGIAARESCDELALVHGPPDHFRHAQLDRQTSKPPELVVRTQDEHVDRRHHLRERLVRDLRKRLAALLVEDEVGPVAEAQELEVVLEDAVDPLDQAVVRLRSA